MKSKLNHDRAKRRLPIFRYEVNQARRQTRTKFELAFNRFFYRLFFATTILIVFAAIYEQAWHQLFTAITTFIIGWVIYDETSKYTRP